MFDYHEKHVLVTGGLGFVGSSLALRLAELGAHVVVVDSGVEGCGANPFNLYPHDTGIRIVHADIGNLESASSLLKGVEIIFNVAGEICHGRSMDEPGRDLDLNVTAHLNFLTACARFARGARVVFASTRQVYGSPEQLPVSETHPTRPVDFNGIHKLTGEGYHALVHHLGQLDTIALRLTNVFGPRMAINIPGQGFLNTYFRSALLGKPLKVFGNGQQLRDPIFIGDCVRSFLAAGLAPPVASTMRIFNVGGPQALSLEIIAREVAASAGCEVEFCPFPVAKARIDIGSYAADLSRISSVLGWSPSTRFSEGVQATISYYRTHGHHYLPGPAQNSYGLTPRTDGERRLPNLPEDRLPS